MFYLLVTLLSIFDTLAIVLARVAVEKKSEFYKFLSLFFFAISAVCVVLLMPYETTAVISILWISFSTIFITMICAVLFKERLNFWQGFGIALILSGVMFL